MTPLVVVAAVPVVAAAGLFAVCVAAAKAIEPQHHAPSPHKEKERSAC